MGDRMGSVLVVYGTWAGSTASVAHRIGNMLTTCGSTVRVVPASMAPDPIGYDAVVIGSGIKGGKWHPAAASWIADNAAKLVNRPTAFFTVCLMPVVHPSRASEARGYTLPLAAATGVRPVDIGVFAGAFDPDQHAFKDRASARMLGAKAGDFRDWHAIDAWATRLAPQLATA